MAKAFKELTEEERQRQQRRQEIARLWAEGESYRAIGERFGLTRQAVHDILRRMEGGPVTPGFAQLVRRWPYPNAARWVLESGYTSIAELARETGIPDNTLRNILRGNTFSGLEVTLVNTMSRETMLREYLKTVRNQYDVILLDCCPSLGMLTINALAAADEVLIPMQAHYLSIKGLEQLIHTIGKVKRQINPRLEISGILITMADMRTAYSRERNWPA